MALYTPPKPTLLVSTLTRPADTNAYAQNDLIASSTTAGSVVVPSFVADIDETDLIEITGGILYTSGEAVATFAVHVDLWSVAPTFTNGDNGTYAIASGMASWLGHLSSDVVGTFGRGTDGAAMDLSPGSTYLSGYSTEGIFWARKPGDKLYWSMYESDSTGMTPTSGETFRLSLRANQH
jgi:hypothetical protein